MGRVFGAESDIPPLCSPGCAFVSDPAGKAELLSMWFDSKQSRDIVELPQTCHPRPAFCGIAFRAREVERHLLDLDPNGGVDTSGCFPMFFRKTASVLAPKLSCLFHRLLRGGEFPLEWRIADLTPIPKGLLSALVCNYRQISITPVLSKVFERLIALRFGRFLERSGVLPSRQYWNYTGVESLRSSRLISVRPLTGLIMGALCLNCGKLELVAWSWRFSRIFCPVVLRELRLVVRLVQVLMSYLVCHRVVFLVHCCLCCTLLTFQGFVGYHILVIGHPWQHHWMKIWLWSAIGAVGGACWWIQVRREGC